jgi:hypothetical protein
MSARKTSSLYLLDLEKETKKLLEQLDLDTPHASSDSESELESKEKDGSNGMSKKASPRTKSRLSSKSSDSESEPKYNAKTKNGSKGKSVSKGETIRSVTQKLYESPSSSEEDDERKTRNIITSVSSFKTRSTSKAKVHSDSDNSDLRGIIKELQKTVNFLIYF